MPFVDKGLQANLLAEMKELYEKRGRLEADIRTVDAVSKRRMEKSALRDIEAYRDLHLPTKPV